MSGSFGPSVSGSGGSVNLASPPSIGDVTPNIVNATDFTSRSRLVSVPSSVQILIATSSIACTSSLVPITSASNITLTSFPQINTGLNGQKITLVNTGTFAITFINGNNLLLPLNIVLYGGRQISFTYLANYTAWVYDGLVPESVALTGVPTTPTASFNSNSTQVANTAQVFNHLYNHDFPGWRTLPLTANWVTFGAPFATPAIKRVGRDMVFIQGVVVVSGSYNNVITTLPVDCRPPSNINLIGFCSGNIVSQITVSASGTLTNASTLAVGQFQVISISYAL